MTVKVQPKENSWRVFVNRTSLMAGVLVLGFFLYSEKNKNAVTEDAGGKTYVAKKVSADEPALDETPQNTTPRQSAWQSSVDGYVNASDPGDYSTGFGEITVIPVGQAKSESSSAADGGAATPAASASSSSSAPAETSGTAYKSEYKPEYKPESPVATPAASSAPPSVSSSPPPVAAAPPSPPAVATVPIPPLSPPPMFSGTGASGATGATAGSGKNVPTTGASVPARAENETPVTGYRVGNFLDIFDFDITPDWVTSRWKHVASVGPVHTRGYRVPLVTGTDKSDLVGNLTYYFDAHLEVEKITFEGFTGDLDRLAITLRHFNMAKRLTSDPNMLIYETPKLGKNRSYLKSYHRTALEDENYPHRKFWITLELYPPEDDD